MLAQNFWIISPRREFRAILSKCLRCFRMKPKPFQPSTGDHSSVRENEVKVLQCVDVDFGGSFIVTLGKSRGVKSKRAYLCLFVCIATKSLPTSRTNICVKFCMFSWSQRLLYTNLFRWSNKFYLCSEKAG